MANGHSTLSAESLIALVLGIVGIFVAIAIAVTSHLLLSRARNSGLP